MTRLPRPLIRLLIAVKRAIRRILRSALMRYARAAPDPKRDPEDKVYILLVSAWGMGGTIRAAINLASYLADRHDVEIISTYRRNEQPYFAFDERVKVIALDDQRKDATPRRARALRSLLRRVPSALYHPADIRAHNHNLWTDVQLVRRLRGARGIAIASRPGHNILLADLAVPGLISVGLEQMNLALARQDPAQGDGPPLPRARRAGRAHRPGPGGLRAGDERDRASDVAAARTRSARSSRRRRT